VTRDDIDGSAVSPSALTASFSGSIPTMRNAASPARPIVPMTRASTPIDGPHTLGGGITTGSSEGRSRSRTIATSPSNGFSLERRSFKRGAGGSVRRNSSLAASAASAASTAASRAPSRAQGGAYIVGVCSRGPPASW
jgi:hypothetical protein